METNAMKEETKATADHEKNTDIPRDMVGNPPGIKQGIAVVAEPEVPAAPAAIWTA